jgi:hypothetical protein
MNDVPGDGYGDTSTLSPYPEMGGNTGTRRPPPFSLRLPERLRTSATQKATASGQSLGKYIRALLEADLSGLQVARRRRKYDELRKDLAKVHASIILCGNRIERSFLETGESGTQSDDDSAREMLNMLKDATSALVLLTRLMGVR